MRLGVYGGSFDPPHLGHVGAVRHVLLEGLVDRVLVIPAFEHAFSKDSLPFDERLELCRLAFRPIQDAEVLDIERDLPRPSYTINTLEALQEAYPDAELRLIVGADVLNDLPRWRRVDDVKQLAPLLVLGRVGVETSAAPEPVLPDIASSRLRDALRSGQRLEVAQQLPPAVWARIEEAHLYG